MSHYTKAQVALSGYLSANRKLKEAKQDLADAITEISKNEGVTGCDDLKDLYQKRINEIDEKISIISKSRVTLLNRAKAIDREERAREEREKQKNE